MKIAIMTWFSYCNYGTVLQAMATCRFLNGKGHDAKIIQYYPKIEMKRGGGIRDIFNRVRTKIMNKGNYPIIHKTYADVFERYIKDNVVLTRLCKEKSDLEALEKEYDAFICGSDQIWSPMWFDGHYFLDFVNDDSKKIAYAPSFGVGSIDDLVIRNEISDLLQSFTYLSSREKQGVNLVKELIGREPQLVLDPTFLLSKNEWITEMGLKESNEDKYLLIYFLGYNEKYWKESVDFANKMGMSIRIIPVYKKDLEREGVIKEGVNPAEFLDLILNASYICTDSFHGIALAINFGKQFCCFERFSNKDKNSQNSRIYNILEQMELNDRLFVKNTKKNMQEWIDYSQKKNILEFKRKESANFLISALDDIKPL